MILHPMYVIIEEDTICAERTPPWGCATIEDYVERLRKNLDNLERYPEAVLSFEFSGMELEALAERDPECANRMRILARQGKISFVNGTYAQPHLQILESESVFRQFEVGLAAIERLVGHRVNTYVAGEPGIVEQLPQILRSFGYRFALIPSDDTFAIRFLDEHELIGLANPRALDFVNGDEFTNWQGLDGTHLPLYLALQVNIEADFREIEIFDKGREDLYAAKRFFPGAPTVMWNDANRGLYASGTIKVANGDMAAVTEEWLRKRLTNVDFVLLDKALEKRIQDCPPKTRARMYEYWSYAEGVRAEEQLRLTRTAESGMARLSALSTLSHLFLRQPGEGFTSLWKRILWTQHHDAYWFGGVELRQKCVDRLKILGEEIQTACLSKAKAIATAVAQSAGGAHSLVLLNPSPYARQDVATVDCAFETGEAGSLNLPDLPTQVVETETHEDGSLKRCQLLTLWESDGLGYTARPLAVDQTGKTVDPIWNSVPRFEYENAYYRVIIGEDGLFDSLFCKQTGTELLDCTHLKGNEVRFRLEGGEWLSSRQGPVTIHHTTGPVADILRIESRVGGLPIETQIFFYHHSPRIEFRADITFDQTELGVFWDDATKLNVYWPLSFSGAIRHDVPFGVVDGRERRPLLATRWVDVSDERMGFTYFNRGTVKHWINDRTLANVWAWGTNGNCFNNRNLPALFMKGFDLRLNGRQRIEYAICPHSRFEDAQVVRMAHSYTEPLFGIVTANSTGVLSSDCSALRILEPALASTVVESTSRGLRLRVYNTSERAVDVAASVRPTAEFRSLEGMRQDTVNPHQIGWLYWNGIAEDDQRRLTAERTEKEREI